MAEYFPDASLQRRIIALPDLGLVYVKNPKAASSTLVDWLDWLHRGEQSDQGTNIHRHNSLPGPGHVGWRRIGRMLGGRSFRFTFVREPLARFESAYRSKFVEATRPRTQVQRTLGRPEDPGTPVSFEDFVAAVEMQDPLLRNLHWRAQHLNLMHPLVTYDHIGRVETFDDDMARICAVLDVPPPARVRNVTSKDRSSEFEGRPDLVARVRRIYERDYELYGY